MSMYSGRRTPSNAGGGDPRGKRMKGEGERTNQAKAGSAGFFEEPAQARFENDLAFHHHQFFIEKELNGFG